MAETPAAPPPPALPADRLRRRCDPAGFPFETTAELAPPAGLIGQPRATDALVFGLEMEERGFNVYVAGPPGTGKATAVRAMLDQAAKAQPVPPDWCYVHNFADPGRPRALRLPPGQGRQLREGLRIVIQAARRDIPRAFESEEYITRREAIISELNRHREQGLADLSARAQRAGFLLQPSALGIVLVPVLGNRPMTEDEVAALRPEMRQSIDRARDEVSGEVRDFLKLMRAAERETRARLEAQDREVALHAVGGIVEDLAEHYTDMAEVSKYLEEVRDGILADVTLFRRMPLAADGSEQPQDGGETSDLQQVTAERAFRKYELNVVVDNGDTQGAPVVMEPNPTYPNLVGRIDREAVLGALVTDFTMIAPGALHRANGGYLVLRIEDVLRAPAAWDVLKRSLTQGCIATEEISEALGFATTRRPRPDPIPLHVKVFLLGDASIHYLLNELDPDFRELFKVRADFDVQMDRTPDNEQQYAALLSASAAQGGRHLTRGAVARVIEESSRMVSDQRKLSTRFGEVLDLVREANHWAQSEGTDRIHARHVVQAIEKRLYRSALVRERLSEMVARGVLLVRPLGEAVGQVLGLAVLGLGDRVFGQPSRITATAGAGPDGVIDIERQAELGGPIHSKGVMILGGYLADTYASDKPLALSARLVFEQSYSEVEGDSASLAELLALLSRLAEVPLRQTIAVTGSVNQRGEVQAVGGVNEKIEGFFDVCQAIGLSGEHGVILPASNVENLMLRDDVIAAAAEGKFRVYPVQTVDQALEILTGMPAGPRRPDGSFAPEGIHTRVDARLRSLAEALRAFAGAAGPSVDSRERPAATHPRKPGQSGRMTRPAGRVFRRRRG